MKPGEIADILKVSRTTYLGWERKTPPQAHIFRRISVILGVPMEMLLGADPEFEDLKEYGQHSNSKFPEENPPASLVQIELDLQVIFGAARRISESLKLAPPLKLGTENRSLQTDIEGGTYMPDKGG